MSSAARPAHRTKIVATIGPASESPSVLQELIRAGLDVARLNFSHGDFPGHSRVIDTIRAAEKAAGRRVAIMADLSGPKIRIGALGVEKIQLQGGDPFTLTTDEIVGDRTRMSVSFKRLPQVVKRGDTLSLNDGYVQLEVEDVRGADVACVVRVGGELRAKKGLNLPGIDLGISAFTDRDRECLAFALGKGVDAVSQSFVESAADIEAVRTAARSLGHRPFIIAKIERSRALDRLDEILDASDGVMIARGDLGVEIPIERIALVQKDIMRRAGLRARPVITATQMLESMTTYRLPTRAEATDVSNAILDGTDAVMLSAESATGAYPVEAVAMLARIAAAVEPAQRPVAAKQRYAGIDLAGRIRPEHLIAVSIEASLEFLRPALIVVPSATGATARLLASLRLPVPVVAICSEARTCRHLQFSYGVTAVHRPDLPVAWTPFVRDWMSQHGLRGEFAILVERVPQDDPAGTHRIEIIRVQGP
jgi:pyruvate kinase